MANKTTANSQSIDAFLASIEPEKKRADAFALLKIFFDTTGWVPKMWGPSIVGFGQYHYRYDSGREGDFLATGFSPRKTNLVVYIMPGYADFSEILKDLGKHKLGKSCLYINKLDDIDPQVLARLIRAGLDDLQTRWDVQPS